MFRIAVLPVHENIICDGCKANPVIGVRWKCLVCDDFDLCDACHSSGSHSQHQMLQIEIPGDAEDLKEDVSIKKRKRKKPTKN